MHSPTVTEGPLAGSQGRQLSTTTGDSGRHTVQPKARIAVTQVSEEGAGLGPGRLPSTRQPGGSERESCVCRRKPTSRGVPAGTVRRPLIREVSGRPSSAPPPSPTRAEPVLEGTALEPRRHRTSGCARLQTRPYVMAWPHQGRTDTWGVRAEPVALPHVSPDAFCGVNRAREHEARGTSASPRRDNSDETLRPRVHEN